LPPMDVRLRLVDMPTLHKEIYEALLDNGTEAREDLSALGRTALRLLMAATSPALLVEGSSRYEPLAYQLPPLEVPRHSSLYG
ncbi:DNA helicase, partial [Streptomyces sp. SID11233]|nr:DNA helicase [Streptomyces sp. SID11233]